MNSTQNNPDDKSDWSETNSNLGQLSSQNPNTAKNTSKNNARNNSAGVAINALSRVLAVMVLGAAVAGLGALLDSWLGTNYWTLVGVIAGMILAIPGLFLVAKVSELDAKRMAAEDRATSSSAANNSGESNSGGNERFLSTSNTGESAHRNAPSNPPIDQ